MAAAIVMSDLITAAKTTAASVTAAPAAIASAAAVGLTESPIGRSRPNAIPLPAPRPRPVPRTVGATNTQLTSSPGTIPSTAATRLYNAPSMDRTAIRPSRERPKARSTARRGRRSSTRVVIRFTTSTRPASSTIVLKIPVKPPVALPGSCCCRAAVTSSAFASRTWSWAASGTRVSAPATIGTS